MPRSIEQKLERKHKAHIKTCYFLGGIDKEYIITTEANLRDLLGDPKDPKKQETVTTALTRLQEQLDESKRAKCLSDKFDVKEYIDEALFFSVRSNANAVKKALLQFGEVKNKIYGESFP